MSLFDKVFRPTKAKESEKALHDAEGLFYTLRNYHPVFHDWHGKIYESEIVRAAIDARARHISKLKIEPYGTANPSLQAKLKLGMNQWQSNSQFLYRVSTILDVENTCFITPVFDADMRITGYYPVLPTRCEIVEYEGAPWLRYKFSHGQTAAVKLEEVAIMTKHQYLDDFYGEKNHALDETMKLIHLQAEGIREAVTNSSTFRFMAQLSNFAKPEDLALEAKRFRENNLSARSESNGFLLFPNTYKDIRQIDVKPYTVDSGQMEMIQKNVCNYFGVNQAVLENSAKAEDLEAFYDGCVEPFAIQFSEVMTKAAFSERERAQGSGIRAASNRLQYMSTSAKVQMAKELGDRGAILIDEIRELFNYDPLPDGAGQVAPIRGEYKATETLTDGGADNANEE